MISCDDYRNRMVAVLDDESSEEDRKLLFDHLAGCPECRAFYGEAIRTRHLFSIAAATKPTVTIGRQFMRTVEADASQGRNRSGRSETSDRARSRVDLRLWAGGLAAAVLVLISWLACYAMSREVTELRGQLQGAKRDLAVALAPGQAAEDRDKEQRTIGGRLSVPRKLPMSVDIAPPVTTEPDGITVPSDLVAWLDAARLFKRLGMEERMGRAFEYASELTPYDAVASISTTGHTFTVNGDDEVFENKNKHSILTKILGPHESVGSISGIMAQSFGDYCYENEMD